MYYVYVLRLSDGTFYKGFSENIDIRLKDHSSKKVDQTKNKLPFDIVHIEICKDRISARRLEKYFKSGFGREIISEIAGVVKWYTR